jgi:YidC/Oxa1 family membrane protein insertase
MKLYNKAGVNPMAGCIPGLMQAPIFYALFQFFPSAISLRQKDFFGQMIYLLLTPFMSYHFIFQLGSHISLFPILASIAIFFILTGSTNGCSYTGCRYGKNDENHDLCFTINDVVFL